MSTDNNIGGDPTIVTITITGSSVDFPSTIKSLKVIFPSRMPIVIGGVVCTPNSYVTSCSSGSKTILGVNLDSTTFPPPGTITITLTLTTGVKNPIYETGPFLFTLKTVGLNNENDAEGGYGTDIQTATSIFTKNFIVPTVSTASLVYGGTTVFTSTTLDVTIVPTYPITAPSEIRIDFPFLESSYLIHFFSSTGSVGCSSVSIINAAVSCTYSNTKSLSTTGAFSTDVASGSTIKLRLASVLTPLSTTPVVDKFDQTGIKVYIQDDTGIRYMQTAVLTLSVTTPIAIPVFTPSLASSLVGATTSIQIPLTFAAPFLPGSVFTFTFSNLDVSAASISPSSSIIGSTISKTSSTLIFNLDSSLYRYPVILTGFTLSNIVNNVGSFQLG